MQYTIYNSVDIAIGTRMQIGIGTIFTSGSLYRTLLRIRCLACQILRWKARNKGTHDTKPKITMPAREV